MEETAAAMLHRWIDEIPRCVRAVSFHYTIVNPHTQRDFKEFPAHSIVQLKADLHFLTNKRNSLIYLHIDTG